MYYRYISIAALRGHLRRLIKLGLVHSLCLAVPCAAQIVHKHERGTSETDRPASDARSFVELFTKIERDWTQAVQKKDKAALDAILAPEFMFRNSENPENPLSREHWIQHELSSCDIRSFSHRAIAVRAFLGVAVVSVVESRLGTINGKDCSGDYFIVDIWETNHNKWQASARYVAPLDHHLGSETKITEMTLRPKIVSAQMGRVL
jgi:Domain of unknown function (DUF4440)